MTERHESGAGGRLRRWADRRRAARGDRGASMVEFAIVAPVLFLLLFGIIDFGWLLNQQQDVRYGAREGARIAAVASKDSPTLTNQQIVNDICDRMDAADSNMRVSLIATSQGTGIPVQLGDLATIQVWKPAQDITGFFTEVIGDSVLKSELTFRLETQPNWANTTALSESGGTVSGGLACT